MLTPVLDFGTNPGALDMYEYAPADLPAGRPVVVVLHGCTQQAPDMEAAGWNALADAIKFTVVYPGQRTANQPLGCFTWYAGSDTARDNGEAQSVIHMVDHAIAAHGSDPSSVFVTGVSAGGAFTAVMLAAYPDRFAAGSAMAAIPFHCATDALAATACTMMSASAQRTPMQWGDLVRAAAPSFTGAFPRLQIFQGDADTSVAPANATELVEQWTNVWAIDTMADATAMIGPAIRTQYTSGSTVAVELYKVAGMGHAIAIGDDGSGPCPSTAGAFFDDVGVCSTLRAAAFFGLVPDPGPGSGSGSGSNGSGDGSSGDGGDGSSSGCNVSGGSAPPSSLALMLAACALAVRRRRHLRPM